MATPEGSPKKPNFLFIIADDLGFSDIGCYGGEINTPNLDLLAKDGMRQLNFHTAAACSPTRAMLLTGTDAHLGGLGCLIEYRENEFGSKRWRGKPGYEGYLNREVAPVSEILQENGYHTILAGKWHLGLRPDHGPHARGFDRSYSMLPGCCNHFGWEPQLEDANTAMFLGGRPIHVENGLKVDITPNKTDSDNGHYSTNVYTDKLLQYLQERSEAEKEKPFFAYCAYSAPHWPCQAPKEMRDKYKHTYDDGPLELRRRRLENLVKIGIISEDIKAHEVVASDVPEWDEMTEYERQCSSRSMAAYAAMVEQIDLNIGRIINHLKETGEYDNTHIVFMSDNGAEGGAYEAAPVLGRKLRKVLDSYYDNSLDNIGAWNSFTWIGPLWAQASTAPSRLFKGFPTEGGILVPCIAKSPDFRKVFRQGSFSRAFTTCMDMAPTVLDMAGVTLPKPVKGKISFKGRSVHSMHGKSWIPYYVNGVHADEEGGESAAVHDRSYAVGWELKARAAMRQGRWKIVHFEKYRGGSGYGDKDEGWELFDIEADPGETTDLSEREPEILSKLLSLWEEYVSATGVVWGESAMLPGIPKEEAAHLHDCDLDQQRTWIQTPPGQMPSIV